jgi:hypothetical protein
MTLRNNWARSLFENFYRLLMTRLVAWCVPSARSQYLLLFGSRFSAHAHAYLHAYISAKSYCSHFIFFFQPLSTCAYYCLMTNVYLQVGHVPFHESNFMFRCYIREAWTQPSNYEMETLKWRLNGMVIVSYVILGQQTSFFLVLRWYHK